MAGITKPQIERVEGPITVEYDRAFCCINIEDVNHVISTAFAGEVAGAALSEMKEDLIWYYVS